ncbi:unnamed protein product [Effrenium voratum]|nr:unnamed protein product [Effrenium voratum]
MRAEKAQGAYADASMRMVIRSVSSANEAGVEAAHQAAHDSWSNSTEVLPGAVLSPDNAYTLKFDSDSWVSFFKIEVEAEANIAIFTEHLPKEFESRVHYLINDHGEEVQPAFQEGPRNLVPAQPLQVAPTGPERSLRRQKPRGDIGALVMMLPSLLGALALVFACPGAGRPRAGETPVLGLFHQLLHFMNAAASGILFSFALFLLLPEASRLLAVGKTEVEAAAAWGSAVIAGWLMGSTSHLLGHVLRSWKAQDTVQVVEIENGGIIQKDSGEKEQVRASNWQVATPLLFGDDFFCNLADGFVVGTAFFACDASFAWKIVGVIILHQTPQELADIYVMISKANFSWKKATLLNFLCSLSALVGACIAYSVRVSVELQGAILAIGAGVFLFVACTELGPAVVAAQKDAARPLLSGLCTMATFVLAAVCIGLVLLGHEHCSAAEGWAVKLKPDPATKATRIEPGSRHWDALGVASVFEVLCPKRLFQILGMGNRRLANCCDYILARCGHVGTCQGRANVRQACSRHRIHARNRLDFRQAGSKG